MGLYSVYTRQTWCSPSWNASFTRPYRRCAKISL